MSKIRTLPSKIYRPLRLAEFLHSNISESYLLPGKFICPNQQQIPWNLSRGNQVYLASKIW